MNRPVGRVGLILHLRPYLDLGKIASGLLCYSQIGPGFPPHKAYCNCIRTHSSLLEFSRAV